MAQILDKQGLQHYANKMCNADNRKVGSKSLPTAFNEIDTAIDGFKTLFESEYGSALDMKLENNENVFSVGTGTNVDRRSEVENSFTDIELYGNSLVNIAPNYEINWTHSGTWLSNFLMTSTYQNSNYFKAKVELKPNTTYSIIANVTKNTSDIRTLLHNASAQTCYFQESMPISAGQTGVVVFVQKTISDFNALNVDDRVVLRSQSGGATTGETIIKDIIILEGDYTNKPLPQYFEGLKSVGQKEDGDHKISISSMGKNLFNMKRVDIRGNAKILNKTYNSVTVTTLQNWAGIQIVNLKLKPNTNYKLKFDRNNDKIKAYIRVRTASGKYSGNANFGGSNDLKFTMPKHSDYIALSIETEVPLENAIISNIQLEENSTATSYEPYKEDKKEISLNEPLRGLPNGVKDTIEKVNGEWKIVRRCKQTTLTGDNLTEFVVGAEGTSIGQDVNRLSFILNDVKYKTNSTPFICDKFSYVNFHTTPNGSTERNIEAISFHSKNSKELNVHLLKTKLSEQTSASAKSWLNANPVTVVYELENYIIEDISPVTLQCWKNGTISIDEVLPVETTHTVALNKSAQIQKNIEELTLLRNRVEALEKQYNNSTLNQAYELELLRLDMELDNIV